MNLEEFQQRGYEMIDYIADYHQNIRQYTVTPDVEPGFLFEQLPLTAPEEPEPWEDIMNDLNTFIMPGMTHWQHPNFHAYFPVGTSYASILGDLFASGTSNIGFSWVSDPVGTEMECLIVDWLAEMFGLPEKFLFLKEKSKGGGVIQNSASECIFVALLAARHRMMKKLKAAFPTIDECVLLSKLVAYCSSETHSCAEKAAMIGFVNIRKMNVDEKLSLRGPTFARAVKIDKQKGLIPFFLVATCGSTSSCAFDNIDELGAVCEKEDIWMHVDASFAGTSMVCEEFRYLFKGVEYSKSFNFNPAKWMLTTFDTTVLWVDDRKTLTESLSVDPTYLKHNFSRESVDFRHWEIPLGRKCRSIKLWFVIRNYGVSGIQKHVREAVRLLKMFEGLMRQDDRFEIINEVIMGLVSFRLKGSDLLNENLLSSINQSGQLYMVPANLFRKYVIRFGVNYEKSTEKDILHAWDVISNYATDVLEKFANEGPEDQRSEAEAKASKGMVVIRRKQQLVHSKRCAFVRMTCDFAEFQSQVVTYPL